jgi:hypothetical protein
LEILNSIIISFPMEIKNKFVSRLEGYVNQDLLQENKGKLSRSFVIGKKSKIVSLVKQYQRANFKKEESKVFLGVN